MNAMRTANAKDASEADLIFATWFILGQLFLFLVMNPSWRLEMTVKLYAENAIASICFDFFFICSHDLPWHVAASIV